MTDLVISQERLEQIVKTEVENQFIKNPELFEKLVVTIIKNKLLYRLDDIINRSDFKDTVNKHMDSLFQDQHGYFYTNFTRILNKIFTETLTVNNYYFERIISSNVYRYMQSNETINSIVEPLLTQAIVHNSGFLTYVKSSVDNHLAAKLKRLNNLITSKITDTLVQDHIQDYLKMRKDLITQEDLKDVE